ncbi:MAG: protein kinase [Nostocaceae cyanobacterium]|nr:protein kinase [Nostocaceae cyanobacterium]
MVWTAKKQLLEGKYTIEEVLPPNRGITYLAKDQNGVPAVIKTLNDEFRHDTDFQQLQQSFVTEAGKLAKCHHPHIVRHFETFLEDDVWCVAMEYVVGIDLAQKIRPQTETGFTAPELYVGTDKIAAYTDIYSLGATLYNLLTGQIPVSAQEQITHHLSLKSPKELNPLISDRVSQGILWAMLLDPKRRPQSVQEWLAEISDRKSEASAPENIANVNENSRLVKQPAIRGLGLWIVVVLGFIGVLFVFQQPQSNITAPVASPTTHPSNKPVKHE